MATLQEIAHPGTEWAMGTEHTQKFEYAVNKSTDMVKKYTVTNSWSNKTSIASLPSVTLFAENQLLKSIVYDEDRKPTIEFKNGLGQTILVRKTSGSEKLDTYYIYDMYGQLVFVITPKAEKEISQNGNTVTQTILDKLCYQYKYDNKGRAVEKKLPGKGWEYFVYDLQNRLVASQNAVQRTGNTWFFTRYDAFGRILYTGQFVGGNRLQEQTNAEAKGLNNETRSTTPFTVNNKEIFYTNTGYPSAAFTAFSINYYDSYPGTNIGNTMPMPTDILGEPTLNGISTLTVNGVNSIRTTKTLPTASLVKNIEDNGWTTAYIWYDQKTRAIGSYTTNHLGGYTQTEKKIEFSGAVLLANTYHKRLMNDTEKSIKERFEYDHQFRIKKHYHQVNTQPEILLAEYTYNELGQLTNKKVGGLPSSGGVGGGFLQSIDYTYNIRGWVTKINNPDNLNGKLFAYETQFTQTSTQGSTANYNGNISEVTWKTTNDAVLKRYNYQYDGYNRLLAGIYSEPSAAVPQNNFYNETLSYDENGNITHLQRNKKAFAGNIAEQIDDLQYTYSGNQLERVTDNSANYMGYPDVSGNVINYDANGNMTSQADKGINNIFYNALDLPKQIIYNESYIPRGTTKPRNVQTQYKYRADGTKIGKVYYGYSTISNSQTGNYQTNLTTYTDYIAGFQYEYKNDNGTITPTVLKIFATAEGYYDFQNNRYIYNYVDHLGNVRLSYFRNGNNSAEVLEENNFYPFGLRHSDNAPENYVEYGEQGYAYKYNGKELQFDSGMYDYGARFYMPELGRWGVVDPLAEVSRRFSPYAYANNNPIMFIDPDGRTSKGAMDIMKEIGGNWQNVGYGFFNADSGTYIDYEGNILSSCEVQEKRSFLTGGIGGLAKGKDGSDGGRHIYYVSNTGYVLWKEPYEGTVNKFIMAYTNQALHLNDSEDADKRLLTENFEERERIFIPISIGELIKVVSSIERASWGNLLEMSHGDADFTMTYLVENYFSIEEKSSLEIGIFRTTYVSDQHFFRFGNDYRLFNLYDAGNLMWGAWMANGQFSYSTALLGAQLNEFFRDTKADQRAIKAGIYLFNLYIQNKLSK